MAQNLPHIDQLVLLSDSELSISREKWTERWWRWLLEISKPVNPALDSTGKHCASNQVYPDMWFLTGTLGGRAKRNCTVPTTRAILLPIINDEQSLAEKPDLKTDSELESLVAHEADSVVQMSVSIDSLRIFDLKKYRVRTRAFDITLPQDNIWGVKAGPTRAAADGYWLFLRPLSVGQHTIHVFGKGGHFESEVEYSLTVEEGLP